MKKTAAFFIIALTVFSLGASTFTFSGEYILTGKGGKSIQRESVDISRRSVALRTENGTSEAESLSISIKAGENSLIVFSETRGKRAIYLVYGEMTVIAHESLDLSIYTPVTLIDGVVEGEIYITSTENEEKFYNFSSRRVTVLDTIRGKESTVYPQAGFDYIKDTITKTDETKKITQGPAVSVPPEPVFDSVSGNTVPSEPVLSRQTAMTITQTLVSTDDERGR